MNYYKVIYAVGSNNERIYPSSIKEAVWNTAQYHFTDNVMIGGTDDKVDSDGVEVIELTEDEALSSIEEFKKSYPEFTEEELPFLPKKKDELKSARAKSSMKKRSRKK